MGVRISGKFVARMEVQDLYEDVAVSSLSTSTLLQRYIIETAFGGEVRLDYLTAVEAV